MLRSSGHVEGVGVCRDWGVFKRRYKISWVGRREGLASTVASEPLCHVHNVAVAVVASEVLCG